jgi:Ala-tRNA(Pro) deacylase
MGAPTSVDRPYAPLLEWLERNEVEHRIHPHAETFTAAGPALAEGVHPHTFAKVVGVATGAGGPVLLVLDATDKLDLEKAAEVLEADDLRLLTERELAGLAPGCAAGAVPAVGTLFDLPMRADEHVRLDDEISFNAGSHRHTVRVDRRAWERATGVVYADLAVARDGRPAWARS